MILCNLNGQVKSSTMCSLNGQVNYSQYGTLEYQIRGGNSKLIFHIFNGVTFILLKTFRIHVPNIKFNIGYIYKCFVYTNV